MGSVISFEDFMASKRIIQSMESLADGFVDENGWSLAERERRTVFGDETVPHPRWNGTEVVCPDGWDTGRYWVEYGDPRHPALWALHRAALLNETSALVDVLRSASNSAWVAAAKILGLDLPRRPKDHDPLTMI